MNITVDKLKEAHGDKASAVFQEIASLGGFGNVPADQPGGLDLTGALDPDNKAITASNKAKIADLAGVKSKKEGK